MTQADFQHVPVHLPTKVQLKAMKNHVAIEYLCTTKTEHIKENTENPIIQKHLLCGEHLDISKLNKESQSTL